MLTIEPTDKVQTRKSVTITGLSQEGKRVFLSDAYVSDCQFIGIWPPHAKPAKTPGDTKVCPRSITKKCVWAAVTSVQERPLLVLRVLTRVN